MQNKILVIDDDQKLTDLLTTYLEENAYKVKTVNDSHAGIEQLDRFQPHLIILDIMLPDLNGFEVLKIIRKNHSTPVIMLTARGEVTDKIVGLELGADDYLPKPFEPRELIARIQAILRRVKPSEVPCDKLRFGNLKIDFKKHMAFVDNIPVDLTTNEFAALTLLARHKNEVLNRDQILEALRGMECDAFNRSVDITMSRLRQKLNDDPKNPAFIKTIWGTGYMFIGGQWLDDAE